MKRKLILSVLVATVVMCLFAITISATAIDTDTTVTLEGSFMVAEGSVTNPVVNLYDEDGYALVWYLNTDNKLVSDRAVNLITVTNNKAKFSDVSKFYGGSQQKGVIVVNLRDDFVDDGLAEIKTFDSNFQFGYYGANRNVPIQYFYFPKTATEIIDRMFQNTQLIIADIEPGTPISYMGVHAVAQSNLKEFFVPNDITAFVEKDDLGVFQDTKLEKITFEEGSQIKVIPYRCFYYCNNLKELVLPNSVEEIHYRAIQLTLFDSKAKLEKLVLGANFKGFYGITGDNFYVRGAENVKVYLPATFNADNVDVSTAHQTFTLCPNATFYYCGTEEAWDALIAKISLAKNGATGTDSGENIITAKANGKVVFNYNPCDAFYNGEHTKDQEKSNACVEICARCGNMTINHSQDAEVTTTISYTDFSANGEKITKCSNEGCSLNTNPTVEAMAPLFTCLGYSTPESGNGGISIGYRVNGEAILAYEEITGETVSYGLFATTKQGLGEGDIIDENGEAGNGTLIADIGNEDFAFIFIKMFGFDTEESKKAEFAIGAFVGTTKEGVTTYSYLQASKPNEGEKYAFIKYNDFITTQA